MNVDIVSKCPSVNESPFAEVILPISSFGRTAGGLIAISDAHLRVQQSVKGDEDV